MKFHHKRVRGARASILIEIFTGLIVPFSIWASLQVYASLSRVNCSAPSEES